MTWAARGHFTTYPGCACDVPSHLYSFSFAPNARWSETYSRRPEIRGHLRRVADEYGIRAHVRFDCTVIGIEWDEGTGGWTLETSRARQAQKSSS
jgi:cation diffusion facilitator CzcD-associated flavoprotein CzcO